MTLKKPKYTNQSAFDKVARHLLKQGRKSLLSKKKLQAIRDSSIEPESVSRCAYRGEGGAKCSIGVLISDEEYSPLMEGESVTVIIDRFPLLASTFSGVSSLLLLDLQNVHDKNKPSTWLPRLREVARVFGLNEKALKSP